MGPGYGSASQPDGDRHRRLSNFRIVTPKPRDGLPVSAPTSESEGHRYRDGLILYKERVKCRDKPGATSPRIGKRPVSALKVRFIGANGVFTQSLTRCGYEFF